MGWGITEREGEGGEGRTEMEREERGMEKDMERSGGEERVTKGGISEGRTGEEMEVRREASMYTTHFKDEYCGASQIICSEWRQPLHAHLQC